MGFYGILRNVLRFRSFAYKIILHKKGLGTLQSEGWYTVYLSCSRGRCPGMGREGLGKVIFRMSIVEINTKARSHLVCDRALCNKKAGNRNRTGDLRTTNATHYRLCYTSICSLKWEPTKFSIWTYQCQYTVEKLIKFSRWTETVQPVCLIFAVNKALHWPIFRLPAFESSWMAGYNDLISGNQDLSHPEWQVIMT